jgi:acetyl-CoA acetyltransferase family protein
MNDVLIVSTARTPIGRAFRNQDTDLINVSTAIYMPMLDTAEVVATRYKISREAQDEYACESQSRTTSAQISGRFNREIVPLKSMMSARDKNTGVLESKEVLLTQDEGNRSDTHLTGLAALHPVRGASCSITAGNASQLSDGASACVLTSARFAEKEGLQAIGIFHGMSVAGCEPDEMGIGPVYAVPKLLKRFGLAIDDIGLWELNEAFAVQVIYW